jgi:DNA processing protein
LHEADRSEAPRELPLSDLLGPLNEVERKHAPERLYVAGDAGLLRRGSRVSVVGARDASSAGLRRARKLAAQLAKQGVIVMSGLAAGIDTAAHLGAMGAGGRTIAVLGTPLDLTYPPQNRDLQRQIMAEHLAVSCFPTGEPVAKRNFPVRNRLMALLSDATVIVEAGETSGSLAQGWEAIRLGRLLFVLKSATEVPDLTWPHKMLEYGAQVLRDTNALTSLLPVAADAGLAAVAL